MTQLNPWAAWQKHLTGMHRKEEIGALKKVSNCEQVSKPALRHLQCEPIMLMCSLRPAAHGALKGWESPERGGGGV